MSESKWAAGRYDDIFESEMMDTREEAIDYVRHELDGEGFIGRAYPVTFESLLYGVFCHCRMSEIMDENAFEQIGEAAEDMVTFSSDQGREIEKILTDALSQYVCHNKLFDNSKYKVEQVESIDTTGEDCEN